MKGRLLIHIALKTLARLIGAGCAVLLSLNPVQAAPDSTNEPGPRLTVDLRDGSRIIGKSLEDILGFHSGTVGDMKLPWTGIRSIQYAGTNTGTARLTATNGDAITIQITTPSLHIETCFGKAELPVSLIQGIRTSVTGDVGQNLIGWWKLDDGEGMLAKDSSPDPHDGNLINGPAWQRAPGRDGGALEFGVNDAKQYVSLGNILQGSYAGLTIACWAKHGKSQWNTLVERGAWSEPDGIGLMMDYNGASVTFGHYGGPDLKSKANVQDDQWHHVAGTLEKTESGYLYSVYVDGKLDCTETRCPFGLGATSKGWGIGARFDGSYPYRGLIEDVRIYDRALSEPEIQAICLERSTGGPLPPPRTAP